MLKSLIATTTLAALTLTAHAAQPELAGSYSLASSTTTPASSWGYTKARVLIKKLDDKHLQILLSCEWKREPKAVCGDHMFAQWREDGLYLQDMNTFALRMYFDPATRTLTMISRGADAKASVRRDVFVPDASELTDPALVRRMKREQANADDKESTRVFGHYSKRAYLENRIEFQKP
jgi:hypothetical protein